ncbi:MAG: hypothetical protein NTW05_07640 [Pseudonocardiales bacterium]|jgi:hypothetical protein|nr:hypothetical protein [Pseudonocardiales bacterium]
MHRRPGTTLLAFAVLVLISAVVATLFTASANADDAVDDKDPGHPTSTHDDAETGAVTIRSLDDLAGLPCATGTDEPGSVLLEYGPSTQPVSIYCQAGDPQLTISIDRMVISGADDELSLTGGEVVARPPGAVCDSADLAEGERSCDPLSYEEGDVVTLTVVPDAASRFSGWVESAGTCRGLENPCTVTMDRDRRVSATFGLRDGLPGS